MKGISVSKNSWAFLITLASMALGYVFYFFVYVKSNENGYVQKAHRVLNQLGKNIYSSNQNFKGQLIFYSPESRNESIENKRKVESIHKTKIALEVNSDSLYTQQLDLKNQMMAVEDQLDYHYSNDSISDNLRGCLSKLIDQWHRVILQRERHLNSIERLEGRLDSLYTQYDVTPESIVNNDDNLNLIAKKIKLEELSADEGSKINSNRFVYYEANPTGKNKIKLRARLEDFVQSINNQVFFDEFLIIRGDSQKKEIAYQTFENKISINNKYALLSDSSFFTSGTSKNIMLNDTNYRLFFHQFNFKDQDNWVLVGCIDNHTFVKKTRSIDSVILLNAGLIVLIMIVSMPLMKIIVMSSIERLKTHNVFFTGVSIVLGTPLIILTVLILLHFNSDEHKISDNLKTLSNEMTTRFTQEIDSVYLQLQSYEDQLINNILLKSEMQRILPSKKNLASEILSNSSFTHMYPYFNEVFWMNASGDQIIGFTPYSSSIAMANLENREYFQNILMDEMFQFSDGREFYIQSVTSWTSGLPEIAISKPSKIGGLPVAVITTKINSLMESILPMGYHFALIDESGDVLIHSDIEKSNQENFFKEIDHVQFLYSAVNDHKSVTRHIKYLEKDVMLMTNPIKDMPFSLLVFYDLDQSTMAQSEAWITALVLIFLSFLSCAGVLLILFVCRHKPSHLEYHKFFLSWMHPNSKKRLSYRDLVVSYLFSIVITSIYILAQGAEIGPQIFSISSLPALTLIMTYLHLSEHKSWINHLNFIIGASIVVLSINIVYAQVFDFGWNNVLYQALIILSFQLTEPILKVYKLLEKALISISPRFRSLDDFRRFRLDYNMMLLFWLLTTSVLPVFIFNNISHQHIASKLIREELLHFMQEKEDGYNILNRDILKLPNHQYADDDSINKKLVYGKMNRGIYSLNINDHVNKSFADSSLSKSKLSFDKMSQAKISFSAVLQSPKFFVLDADDEQFLWLHNNFCDKTESEMIQYTYQNPKLDIQQSIEYASISTLNEFNNLFWFDSGTGLNILLIVGLGIVLFMIIQFATSRIYAMNPAFQPGYLSTDPQSIMDTLEHHNVLLLGHANSGRTQFVVQNLGNRLSYKFDMMKLNDPIQWEKLSSFTSSKKFEIAVLDNFEYLYHDHEASSKKLRLLEALMINNKRIVIITETDPKEIIDHYVKEISNATDENTIIKYSGELEVWRHIFSNFIKTYKPINPIDSKVALDINVNIGDEKLTKVIKSELSYGTYLPFLANVLNKKRKFLKDGITAENLILEIQQLAQPYYTALWNTLTIEERFVIYDMAKNDFVNVKNKSTIIGLLKKGMVNYDNGLRLFNSSFRNFVLQANKEEALAMEKVVKQKGSWSKMRNILILVILGLVVLMGFGQPDFFQNINSVILIITGIVSFLPTINGMLSLNQKVGSVK